MLERFFLAFGARSEMSRSFAEPFLVFGVFMAWPGPRPWDRAVFARS